MNDEQVLRTVRRVTLIVAIAFAILGVLLLIFPYQIYDFFGYLLGVCAVGFGVYLLVIYFMRKKAASLLAVDLFGGILLTAFGFTCIAMHARVSEYTAVVFGLLLIAGSIIKFQNAIDLFRLGLVKWWIVTILAGISVVFAILLLARPLFLQDTSTFLLASGIFLLYDSISDFASVILFSRQWKRIRNGVQPPAPEFEDAGAAEDEQTETKMPGSSQSRVDSMEESWKNMRESGANTGKNNQKDADLSKVMSEDSDAESLDQKLTDAENDFKEMQ